MNLDILEFLQFVKKALEKREEERLWNMWVSVYPSMDKKSFIQFNDFYEKQRTKKVENTQKTKEEMLSEVEEIRKMAGRR